MIPNLAKKNKKTWLEILVIRLPEIIIKKLNLKNENKKILKLIKKIKMFFNQGSGCNKNKKKMEIIRITLNRMITSPTTMNRYHSKHHSLVLFLVFFFDCCCLFVVFFIRTTFLSLSEINCYNSDEYIWNWFWFFLFFSTIPMVAIMIVGLF